MTARPSLALAALVLAAGFPVPSRSADTGTALLTEESLAKFRRLYDPDVPPAPESAFPSPRGAVSPGASVGGSWWPGFAAPPAGQGLQSSVNAMLEWNGVLVVAGDFRRAGGEFMHRVATWNGSSWSPLGIGMDHRVFALKEFEGDLIAGGAFTLADAETANFVARWDGNAWSRMDLGPGGKVYSLEVHQDVLYAGGDFPDFLKFWDGTRWQSESGAKPNGVVAALKSTEGLGFGPTLIAGGPIATWGNQGTGTGAFLFRRSGTLATWFRVNGGVNDWVSALHVVNDTLYVGGNFRSYRQAAGPPDVPASRIVGFVFPPPSPRFFQLGNDTGSGVNDAVLAISDLAGAVVVGGQFDTATNPGGGLIAANRIATWNGTMWGTLGTGMASGVTAPHVRVLAKFGPDLYAGGWFTSAGGADSRYIARWIDVPGPALETPEAAPAPALAVRISPNPFAAEAELSFASSSPGAVRLSIHDVAGRRVRTLLAADLPAGVHRARWDGRDDAGRALASGVYFVRLERDGAVAARQVVLAR